MARLPFKSFKSFKKNSHDLNDINGKPRGKLAKVSDAFF